MSSESNNSNHESGVNSPDPPISNKRPLDLIQLFLNKRVKLDDIDDIDDIEYSESDDDKELIIIDKEITCLNDLIELGKLYDSNKRYNIDLKVLNRLIEPLSELDNMIGMETIKQDMIDHILFKIQKFDNSPQDMMHTVIQGPPGVGKTELAKIIGKIYLAMGILKNNNFVKAKRSNLIAGYLGQTAKATQKIIDSAIGGVLFIDEVYSLGNAEKRDSFSKECIDTLNENLTEKKTNLICIIAGYKEEIESCFFSYNPGLERRFPVRLTIEPYKANELFLIFKKKIEDIDWTLANDVTIDFFEKNYETFNFFGGDMEILLGACKKVHSRRVFASKYNNKKIINLVDLNRGFNLFKKTREINTTTKNEAWKSMYI